MVIRWKRGRRARVDTTRGYMVVMVVGEYRGQWRVMEADYPICRPSGKPLGKDTMLVPKWATRFLHSRHGP
jgi:hypothetical protein